MYLTRKPNQRDKNISTPFGVTEVFAGGKKGFFVGKSAGVPRRTHQRSGGRKRRRGRIRWSRAFNVSEGAEVWNPGLGTKGRDIILGKTSADRGKIKGRREVALGQGDSRKWGGGKGKSRTDLRNSIVEEERVHVGILPIGQEVGVEGKGTPLTRDARGWSTY